MIGVHAATLFGRSRPGHKCETALRQLLASTMDVRSVARNLIHDHRVPVAREAEFLRGLPATADSLELIRHLQTYFNTKVRFTRYPAYLASTNRDNLVVGLGAGVLLCRILDLSGLDEVLTWMSVQSRGNENVTSM